MRYAIIAVLVFACLTGVASYGYVQAYSALQSEKAKTKELTGSLQAEQLRTQRIQQTVQSLETKNAKQRSMLQTALDNDKEWAAEPVPDPVADSLCDRPGANCEAREVRTPTD